LFSTLRAAPTSLTRSGSARRHAVEVAAGALDDAIPVTPRRCARTPTGRRVSAARVARALRTTRRGARAWASRACGCNSSKRPDECTGRRPTQLELMKRVPRRLNSADQATWRRSRSSAVSAWSSAVQGADFHCGDRAAPRPFLDAAMGDDRIGCWIAVVPVSSSVALAVVPRPIRVARRSTPAVRWATVTRDVRSDRKRLVGGPAAINAATALAMR